MFDTFSLNRYLFTKWMAVPGKRSGRMTRTKDTRTMEQFHKRNTPPEAIAMTASIMLKPTGEALGTIPEKSDPMPFVEAATLVPVPVELPDPVAWTALAATPAESVQAQCAVPSTILVALTQGVDTVVISAVGVPISDSTAATTAPFESGATTPSADDETVVSGASPRVVLGISSVTTATTPSAAVLVLTRHAFVSGGVAHAVSA
jgi:hypothetical protein